MRLLPRDMTLYNRDIFRTLEIKCRNETKFGKLANAGLYVLFLAVRILKRLRSICQAYALKKTDRVWKPSAHPVMNEGVGAINPWDLPLTQKRLVRKNPRVTIVAELSIPQCKRYRVDQKVAALTALGYEVNTIPFHHQLDVLKDIVLSDLVIFYRTPYWPPVKAMIDECKRLQIPTIYDIDDLVFNVEEYKRHPALTKMSASESAEFIKGAVAYRECLAACDHAIASTETLAVEIAKVSHGKIWIIENALDSMSLRISRTALARKTSRDHIIIGYGSGTKSHDEDFDLVRKALLRILAKYPQVKLLLYGHLNIDDEFKTFAERVEKHDLLPPESYLLCVSQFDINLAPLIKSVFNDSKSNIKYLEAAISEVVTVASPSKTFVSTIKHGINGFLAESEEEWFQALECLVTDETRRKTIGKNAHDFAYDEYRPEITQNKISNIYQELKAPFVVERRKTRVLIVNCLFAPFSFGGATLVVEELIQYLCDNYELAVFTGNEISSFQDYALKKYEANGALVYSVRHDMDKIYREVIQDTITDDIFGQVLEDFNPELVHFHATQRLSIGMLNRAKKFGSKVVVTMHDAWWVCARQFMQKKDGNYCGQKQINLNICGACVGNTALVMERYLQMMEALNNVDLVLAPSQSHLKFLSENLPLNLNISINKNGIKSPKFVEKLPSPKIRFAFLGGINAIHKGFFVLKEIFESIEESDYELLIVDLNRKIANHVSDVKDWNIKGTLSVIPPYDYNSMDEAFASFDVLLAPTQIPESFGMATREAAARGIWVIATNAGALSEEIVEGINGNIVDIGDSSKLRAYIIRCIRDFKTMKKENGVPTYYSTRDQAQELTAQYQSLLNS